MKKVKSIDLNDQGVIRVQSQSPYEQLDGNTKAQLNYLKEIWSHWKKTPMMRDHLWRFFACCQDPYTSALQIMVMSGDFYLGRQNSLAYYIMENFASWTKQQNVIPISRGLKLDALNLVLRQKNSGLIKLVVETYRMKDDKEMFIEPIHVICRNKNYKEACHIAALLELHDHFSIESFIVPLVFQDKYAVAEKFLEGSERHQLELAMFLDNLIGKKSIANEIQSVILGLNIHEPKLVGMGYKPLCKLLSKIINSFNIPKTNCPNLSMKRGKGVIQFLLQKRYIEKSIGEESWREMILEAMDNDENLHAELVQGLIIYGDLKEALHWVERLEWPASTWPKMLLEFRQREKSSPSEEPRVENSDELNFHKLPIPESQIKLVDTASSFSSFINDLNAIPLIGIDAEWKPSFGLKKSELAILQIATIHVVYIVDVMALSSSACHHLWERFAKTLFESSKVLKLGFGMTSDLAITKEMLWKLHAIKTTDVGFLDLALLWKTLVHDFNFVFPFPTRDSSSKTSESLNNLIELCLGKSLDKSDQFSNWEKRPLRRSQIVYAALDAYCLLEVYNIIVAESKKQNIPIFDVIQEIISDSTIKTVKKKKGNKNYQGD